jgi:DNA invertase Pin-like site-specific DNA recombinase
MPSRPLRALVGARVSVVKGPQKVSHEAQLESTTRWADAHGYEVVGQFEDVGVSASVPPEQRPDLGPWLTDEGAERWDAIVWAKMDRAFRSTRHCVDFARWAEERHKIVVFADDGLKLDYRPGAVKGIDAMMAELFVYLGSFFAQLELNRFKTRVEDSHRKLRLTDRWAAGVPPLGFRVVDHPSGRGKGLATDSEGKELLHSMAAKLLDGWSFVRITAWLNETGAQTNKARSPARSGLPEQRRPGWRFDTAFFGNTTTKGPNGLLSLSTTAVDTGASVANLDAFISARYAAEAHSAKLTHWLMSPATAEALSKLKVASGSNQSLLQFVDDGITVAGLRVLTSTHVDATTVAWGVDKSQLRYVLRSGTTVERFPSVTNDGQHVRAISRVGFGFLNPAGVVRLYDAA